MLYSQTSLDRIAVELRNVNMELSSLQAEQSNLERDMDGFRREKKGVSIFVLLLLMIYLSMYV